MARKNLNKSQGTFTTIESVNRPRSSFNLSKKILTTFFAADIVPVGLIEVLPGDTVKIKSANFVRMSTPIFPLMDNIFIDLHWWYCANRLVFANFAKMMGEQENPGDSIDFVVPQLEYIATEPVALSLGDYFGIPTAVENAHDVSVLPFRMYSRIWSEWYRSEDLQDSGNLATDDTPQTAADFPILRRGKRKGYLSAALPFAQKGDPVEISLGASAPVLLTSGTVAVTGDGTPTFNVGTNRALSGNTASVNADWAANATATQDASWGDPNLAGVLSDLTGLADLSAANPISVNELRDAFAMQQLLERDARGGTRQQEQNLAHFGVLSSDQRLNRPEYLGGTSQTVNIHSVANTTTLDGTKTLGTLAAYATSGHEGGTIVRSVTEHGYMICLASTRTELTFQQGLDRHWSRTGKFDFYWPDLAGLGEQPVLSKEIYLTGDPADDEDNSVWGYIGRWDEYRTATNQVTAHFRSNHAATLDPWHLALTFENRPVLDDTFIQEDPPMARVLATGDVQPHFIGDFRHDVTITRVMPLHGTPGLTRL